VSASSQSYIGVVYARTPRRRLENRRHGSSAQRRGSVIDVGVFSARWTCWGDCHPPQDTLVATYWRSRGLVEPIPSLIRVHGTMTHRESGARRPAMAALVEHVEDGPVGVHLTYLSIDGSMQVTVEPRKRSLGPVGGGAVRLGDANSVQELVVAEGIETTASVMQATACPVGPR
jgi:putative DNA primase/helicase